MTEQQSYTPTEKIGTMLIALRDGVVAASEQTKTPQTTIYTWFQEGGGIVEVRSFAEAAERVSLVQAKTAMYDEVRRRMHAKEISEEQLMTTFRKVLEETQMLESDAPAQPQQAQAQQLTINVHRDTPARDA